MRILKPIFLCTTYAAGDYWRQQWGFEHHDVIIVTVDTAQEKLMGRSNAVPVYICGPTIAYDRREHFGHILDYLEMHKFVVMDAQEMGNEFRPTYM